MKTKCRTVASFSTRLSVPNANRWLSLGGLIFFSIYKTSAKTALRSTHEPYQWSRSHWFWSSSPTVGLLMVSRSLDLVISCFYSSVSLMCILMTTVSPHLKWFNNRNSKSPAVITWSLSLRLMDLTTCYEFSNIMGVLRRTLKSKRRLWWVFRWELLFSFRHWRRFDVRVLRRTPIICMIFYAYD